MKKYIKELFFISRVVSMGSNRVGIAAG